MEKGDRKKRRKPTTRYWVNNQPNQRLAHWNGECKTNKRPTASRSLRNGSQATRGQGGITPGQSAGKRATGRALSRHGRHFGKCLSQNWPGPWYRNRLGTTSEVVGLHFSPSGRALCTPFFCPLLLLFFLPNPHLFPKETGYLRHFFCSPRQKKMTQDTLNTQGDLKLTKVPGMHHLYSSSQDPLTTFVPPSPRKLCKNHGEAT